jgi:AraC-like DNA-binding protein
MERCLFAGDAVEIHEYTCAPDDAAWHEVNVIESDAPIVVFPGAIVGIRQQGRSPLVASPNVAVLYRPGQSYTRELRDPRGDRCVYVRVRDLCVAETAVPLDARAFVRHRRLLDSDAIEESAIALVDDVVGTRPVRSERLVRAAVELLTTTYTERLTLGEIATRLAVSPFHLARVFRAGTGFSLHGFRTQLRLRVAWDRLPEARGDLTRLALELGFASHSHFTDSFRRAFGVAPSRIAEAGGARLA